MTDRETLNALACEALDLEDEAAFDLRNLGDVIYHDSGMHDPLPVN